MARKETPIKIASVEYCYVGSDYDFNRFLSAVVHDYLSKDITATSEKVSEKP
ncbi:MAG: hypothetical protein M0R40_05965 [Firmicutes bacterium]|nr:hypothetical protein [Bacillota bacterium]